MIVYMTAFVVNKGQSLIDIRGGELLPWIKCNVRLYLISLVLHGLLTEPEQGNYTTVVFENPFHDLPQKEQSYWTSVLMHTSLPVFSGNATHEPWRVISTAYIIRERMECCRCLQKYMVGTLETSRVYRLGSSHFPFLSMPERVAGIVGGLVGEA